jgi:hypothetical protein
MVSLILQKQNFDKRNNLVNIHSDVLIAVVGKNYADIISILELVGLIKFNPTHSNKLHFSNSFCIEDDYFSEVVRHHASVENKSKSITVDNEGYIIIPIKINNKHQVVRQQSSVENMTDMDNPSGTPICHTTLYNYISNSIQKATFQQSGIVLQPRLSFSKKCGRITTNITQMMCEQRATLIDKEGKSFYEIDFRTSHLQHLIKLIESKPNSINPEEFTRFKIAVLNCDFYNSLGNGYNRETNKRYACRWLASARKNWDGVKSISSLYPSISAFIDTTNNGGTKTMHNKLMASESNLINYTALQDIAVNQPDVLAHSIHDAILVESSYLNHMLELVDKKGYEYFGFKPLYAVNIYNVEYATKKKEAKKKNKVKVKKEVPVQLPVVPEAPVQLPAPQTNEIMKTEIEPAQANNDRPDPARVIQQLVNVFGRTSRKVLQYACEHTSIKKIPCSTNLSDIWNYMPKVNTREFQPVQAPTTEEDFSDLFRDFPPTRYVDSLDQPYYTPHPENI